MKQILKIFLLFALLIQFTPAFPVDDNVNKVDPFPATLPGQFAFYHDSRDGVHHVSISTKMDRLIGIVKINNETYVVRVYDLKTGADFTYPGYFTKENGVYDFVCTGFKGDINTGSIIMADLINLLNYYNGEIDEVAKKVTDKPVKITSRWDGYDSWNENSYDWWLPFYKLSSSVYSSKDTNGRKGAMSLKLLFFGRFTVAKQMNFFKYKSLPVFVTDRGVLNKKKLTSGDSVPAEMAGVTLNLDSNWTYIPADKDTGIFFDTYWIKKISTRDALIGIESYNAKSIVSESELVKLQMRGLAQNECIIADSVKIDNGYKTFSFLIWDVDSNSVTIHVSRSLGIKNGIFKNLNFSAFEAVYNINKEYFDSIINGPKEQ